MKIQTWTKLDLKWQIIKIWERLDEPLIWKIWKHDMIPLLGVRNSSYSKSTDTRDVGGEKRGIAPSKLTQTKRGRYLIPVAGVKVNPNNWNELISTS